LLEEFLRMETELNVADVSSLDALRTRRATARLALEEQERGSNYMLLRGGGGVAAAKDATGGGLFEPARELAERCELYCGSLGGGLPAEDGHLLDRVGRRGDLGAAGRGSRVNNGGVRFGGNGGDAAVEGFEDAVQNMGAEFQLSLAGLPLIVRDLLNRLPLHNGPAPDLEVFLRHVKSLTLPPRPSVVESSASTSEGVIAGDESLAHNSSASWLRERAGDAEALDDGDSLVPLLGSSSRGRPDDGLLLNDGMDDPFRKRQRAKLQQ
jgi:hypothetical protein